MGDNTMIPLLILYTRAEPPEPWHGPQKEPNPSLLYLEV